MGDDGVLPESVAGGFSSTQSESSGSNVTQICSFKAYRALRCARSREGWRGVGRGDVDLYSRRRGLWHWG
jgi:hypothetical protein